MIARASLIRVLFGVLLALPAGRAIAGPPVDLFAPSKPRAALPPESEGPSSVIYPEQRLTLRFSHARHLQQDGVTCTTCHPAALSSVSARDDLLPREAACAACHAIDRRDPWKRASAQTGAPARCAACHVGFPSEPRPELPPPGPALEERIARTQIPTPYLKFNHQLHAGQKIACERCHGDLRQVDLATRAQLPRMSTCLSCHTSGLVAKAGPGSGGRAASPRCATCHLTREGGLLQVDYPSGQLVPSGNLRGDVHGADFKLEHRAVARNAPDYCASCHPQSYCQACHNGVVKPMDLHGGDYVNRHALDARRNQPDCGSCHRRQTFCIGCHERLGVASHDTLSGPGSPPVSAFFPASPRRFHPDGWASSTPGPGHHSFEAQRNLRTCTSCHREESCLVCHSALPGGRLPLGVSPHPRDWTASGRCQALASRNPRVCLKCHRDGSAALGCVD